MIEYAVIDDYGDEWETGAIAFKADTRSECIEWAESENYHSASIVSIEDGQRHKVNQLPYDYSRCMGGRINGEVHPTCKDCMRKISPGREVWQGYITGIPLDNGECDVKISVKQWEEWK